MDRKDDGKNEWRHLFSIRLTIAVDIFFHLSLMAMSLSVRFIHHLYCTVCSSATLSSPLLLSIVALLWSVCGSLWFVVVSSRTVQ